MPAGYAGRAQIASFGRLDEIQQEVGLPHVTADTCAPAADQPQSLSVSVSGSKS
jgi:hypothetical protein